MIFMSASEASDRESRELDELIAAGVVAVVGEDAGPVEIVLDDDPPIADELILDPDVEEARERGAPEPRGGGGRTPR